MIPSLGYLLLKLLDLIKSLSRPSKLVKDAKELDILISTCKYK